MAAKRGRPARPSPAFRLKAALESDPAGQYTKMTKHEKRAVEDMPKGKAQVRLRKIAEKSRPDDPDAEYERCESCAYNLASASASCLTAACISGWTISCSSKSQTAACPSRIQAQAPKLNVREFLS